MNTVSRSFAVRPMSRTEVDLAVEWAALEGWNPGLHDAACFSIVDPGGFLVGELDDEPVSCISAVRYPHRFAFLGFYIVRPEYRGRGLGYGLATWQAACERLSGYCVGLDGVAAQEANYRRSGFVTAYRNLRFGGRFAGSHSTRVIELAAVPFDTIREYDEAIFPAPRPGFLRQWISQPGSHALGLLEDGHLAGYGVVRPCRQGHKIGPLFADNPAVAEELACALAGDLASGLIFLDPPEANPEAVALARRMGLEPVFETLRMYNRQPPRTPLEKVYGVTTFELG